MIEYRLIDGYDGDYRVGENGTVWSNKRGSWCLLYPGKNKFGHLTVCLFKKKKRKG